MSILVVHLRGAVRDLDWHKRSPHQGIYVLDASDDISSKLVERFDAQLASPGQRDRYYRAIEPLLRSEHSEWGRSLPQDVRELILATALALGVRTWQDADLFSYLLGVGAWDGEIELVTDNEAGAYFQQVLRQAAPALGLRSVKLKVIGNYASPRRAPRRLLAHLHPDWRDYARHFRRRFATNSGWHSFQHSRAHCFLYSENDHRWSHLAPIYWSARQSDTLFPVAATIDPLHAKRLRSTGVATLIPRDLPSHRATRRAFVQSLREMPVRVDEIGTTNPDALGRAIRSCLITRALRRLRPMIHAAELARQAASLAPDACAIHADGNSPASRAFIVAGRNQGWHTAEMQHGQLAYESPELAYRCQGIDHLVVWGSSMSSGLQHSRFPRSVGVLPLGSPVVEEQLQRASEPGPRPSILIAFSKTSQAIPQQCLDVSASEVIHAVRSLPDLSFVIKPHPTDPTSYWDTVHRSASLDNLVVNHTDSAYELLASSWLVLTMVSTLGAEAICAGLPVVSIDLCPDAYPSRPLTPEYVSQGAAYVITQPQTLAPLITTLREESPGADPLAARRREFSHSFLAGGPTSAASRIVQALAGLTTSSATP